MDKKRTRLIRKKVKISRHTVSLAQPVAVAVQQLADERHAGNFSEVIEIAADQYVARIERAQRRKLEITPEPAPIPEGA